LHRTLTQHKIEGWIGLGCLIVVLIVAVVGIFRREAIGFLLGIGIFPAAAGLIYAASTIYWPDKSWYVRHLGNNLGPLAVPELTQLYKTSQIRPDALIKQGMDRGWSTGVLIEDPPNRFPRILVYGILCSILGFGIGYGLLGKVWGTYLPMEALFGVVSDPAEAVKKAIVDKVVPLATELNAKIEQARFWIFALTALGGICGGVYGGATAKGPVRIIKSPAKREQQLSALVSSSRLVTNGFVAALPIPLIEADDKKGPDGWLPPIWLLILIPCLVTAFCWHKQLVTTPWYLIIPGAFLLSVWCVHIEHGERIKLAIVSCAVNTHVAGQVAHTGDTATLTLLNEDRLTTHPYRFEQSDIPISARAMSNCEFRAIISFDGGGKWEVPCHWEQWDIGELKTITFPSQGNVQRVDLEGTVHDAKLKVGTYVDLAIPFAAV